MQPPKIVSHQEWLEARKALLAKEKEFTRLRDALSRERQALPWERVEKDYRFEGPEGQVGLPDLFDGRSQLMVYHFMFGPDWGEGCVACSFFSDHLDPAVVHLAQRDVTLIAVSRAPYDKLAAFKARMGWQFTWVSSHGSSFNHDYGVSFGEEELAGEGVTYNYEKQPFPSTEAPGLSVFCKAEDGTLYHSYSTYGRGLDMFITAYHYLDTVPKGRDEAGFDFTMQWLRHHDRYGD